MTKGSLRPEEVVRSTLIFNLRQKFKFINSHIYHWHPVQWYRQHAGSPLSGAALEHHSSTSRWSDRNVYVWEFSATLSIDRNIQHASILISRVVSCLQRPTRRQIFNQRYNNRRKSTLLSNQYFFLYFKGEQNEIVSLVGWNAPGGKSSLDSTVQSAQRMNIYSASAPHPRPKIASRLSQSDQ